MLRRHSAIINLNSRKLTLRSDEYDWSTEIIGSQCAPQPRHSYHVREEARLPIGKNELVTEESTLWKEKLQEILSFQVRGSTEAVSVEQKEKLIGIYNKYRKVFSDSPGKAKNFICELRFHDTVKFNKRSYPIAQSSKAVSYTHLDVYKRQYK